MATSGRSASCLEAATHWAHRAGHERHGDKDRLVPIAASKLTQARFDRLSSSTATQQDQDEWDRDWARLQFELEVTFHLCLGCHKATEPNPSSQGPRASEVPACNEMKQVVAGGPVVDAAPCSVCLDKISMDEATAAQREAELKAKQEKEKIKRKRRKLIDAIMQRQLEFFGS